MVHGLVLIDKDVGWTSHDVVAKCRGLLGTRKVGHAGTLDPPATGLLLVGAGHMTRFLRFLTEQRKAYVAEVVFGTETSTLDDTGEVTATHPMADPGLDAVRAAAATLTGPILQVPPMVSAIKVDGRRLHELAREGVEVERQARPVTIHRFDVHEGPAPGVVRIEVECSPGTYVRTLAADLGTALGGGAHLRGLRRTRSGRFDVASAVPVEAVGPERLLPLAEALAGLSTVVAAHELVGAVRNGSVLPREVLGIPSAAAGPWAVLEPGGALLAVYGPHRGDTVKPEVVVPRPD